ncbi:MAG: hypothetical protein KGZ31_00850 [Sulfuritalea sp.]|nr:hypothetical protein [Sulfuritalea sp.]
MSAYLIAIGLIFTIMAGGILVQRLYRRFAQRNPELGPFRDENGGCGTCKTGSGCSSSSCTSLSKSI